MNELDKELHDRWLYFTREENTAKFDDINSKIHAEEKVTKDAKLSIGDKIKTSDGKTGKIVHIFDIKDLEREDT